MNRLSEHPDLGDPPELPAAFRFLAGHGNAGDAVIGLAFEKLVQSRESEILPTHAPTVPLVVSGGGNLVPMYDHLARSLSRLPPETPVSILPSTIQGRWDLLSRFTRIHLHCRERETFQMAELHGIPATLGHDLAFYLDYRPFLEGSEISSLGTLHAFRTDAESARSAPLPPGNLDLSLRWPQAVWTPGNCAATAIAFISTIARYTRVATDRLHVAIVATMLGKDVEFHANSYFKNRAVFEHSLSQFPNCRFPAD